MGTVRLMIFFVAETSLRTYCLWIVRPQRPYSQPWSLFVWSYLRVLRGSYSWEVTWGRSSHWVHAALRDRRVYLGSQRLIIVRDWGYFSIRDWMSLIWRRGLMNNARMWRWLINVFPSSNAMFWLRGSLRLALQSFHQTSAYHLALGT